MTSGLTIDLGQGFELPIWPSSRSRRFQRYSRELELSELANLKFLLDLCLEVLQLDLDAIIDVAVVHVLLCEEARFPPPLLRLVLNLPLSLLLGFHRPLVRGCTDVSNLRVL